MVIHLRHLVTMIKCQISNNLVLHMLDLDWNITLQLFVEKIHTELSSIGAVYFLNAPRHW